MGIVDNTYSVVELGHFEKPFRNSHPVHPATVHFPLTFLSSAYTLDALYGVTSGYRHIRALAPLVKFLPQFSQLAFLTHALGVVTSIPSMTSGTAEFWELYKKDGLNRADKETTNPGSYGQDMIASSINIGMWHGILNTAAFGYSSYAVWSRWGKRAVHYAPTKMQIFISAMMIPGVAVSAALGGELVYGKGIGVMRMGAAWDDKLQGINKHKRTAFEEEAERGVTSGRPDV